MINMMKGTFVACLVSLALLLDHTLVRAASPVWISAFDNTGQLPSGLIDQRINSEILSLPILGLRFYAVGGAGSYVELAPHLGLGSTLEDHFNQPWTPTGFETDNYKLLSVETGSRMATIYIADDNDIVDPFGGPFLRQTQYVGTPRGLITSGYTTAWFWLDHGTGIYGAGGDFNPIVYRLDILAVPPPPPMVSCSAPLVLECTNGGAVGVLQAEVVDATGSALQVVWTVDGTPAQTNTIPSGGSITQSNLTLTATFEPGSHVVGVTAFNLGSNSATCTTMVTVLDATPPQIIRVEATPSVLWPPNQRMVTVRVRADVEDSCDPSPTFRIVQITSNEPLNHSAPDWEITGDQRLKLRAKRLGNRKGGRVYTIVVQSEDVSGNTSLSSVNVTVPHN